MKKIIFFCFAALCSSIIFATPLHNTSIDVTAKIRKAFHHNFPEVTNASISNLGDYYLVYFDNPSKNSSCRIFYDTDGNVIETIRTYTAKDLVPFLRAKINSKYKGKDIFMITDVSNENEHFYQVILQDEKSLWMVHADDSGGMYIEKRYKRAM